jgi:signal peptidase I
MLGLLGTVGAVALPAVALRAFVMGNYLVPTASMAPTIQVGDRVFAEKITHHDGVSAGDVVTLKDPNRRGSTLIKRVVATEGQIVDIQDGFLLVDGIRQNEPYAAGLTRAGSTTAIAYPYQVPEQSIFVMGDNREHSIDSRSFGAVPLRSVTSRAVYVYWPPDHARALRSREG